MSMKELMAAGNSLAGGDTPEGVSFDGSSDYLSRSSDLTGNADGKTFTFSAWVYTSDTSSRSIYNSRPSSGTDVGIQFFMTNGTSLSVYGKKSDGSVVINFTLSNAFSKNSFYHVLVSVNLANTSDRTVYIDDVDRTASVSWVTYVNANIDFSTSQHYISSRASGGAEFYGRLAHVFLDYTYRDLSVESNRRLFIDSDGKPSDTIPSSPILYLPMTDAATAGSNSGTGGDFTVNGVLDTAGRAPNQWNCSASKFDGANDYLQISGNLGVADGKLITYSGILRNDDTTWGNVGNTIRGFKSTGSQNVITGHAISFGRISCSVQLTDETGVNFTYDYNNNTSLPYHGRYWHVSYSIDVSDNNKRTVIINGVNVTAEVTWTSYSNLLDIDFSSIAAYSYSANNITPTAWYEQTIGEVYLDNTYTDLSTDNPFWDSDTNRPKPVRQVISETGTTPLIAMPLRGNDAGNNLGSGGDFTVNSGPYIGARGGSEYWARSMNSTNTSNYLLKTTTLSGASDTKTVTMAFAFNKANTNYGSYLSKFTDGGTVIHTVTASGSGTLQVVLKTAIGGNCVETNWLTAGEAAWHIVLFSVDVSDTSKRHVYIDGVEPSTPWDTYADANHGLGGLDRFQLGEGGTSTELKTSFYYLADGYIDFSQESNRNLFVDQLGYPKDLTPAIDAGDIASPLIYMKFDDTSALGTNSGTGGDFSLYPTNGTVTAGADVDPNA